MWRDDPSVGEIDMEETLTGSRTGYLLQASDMNFELMAERTRYLKENPKGVSEMCRIMEDMRNESLKEGIKEGMKEAALRMLAAGKYAMEEIANISGLSLEEVNQLKTEKKV